MAVIIPWKQNVKITLFEGLSNNKKKIEKVINIRELDIRFQNSLEALDYLENNYGNGRSYGEGIIKRCKDNLPQFKIGEWTHTNGDYHYVIQMAMVEWVNKTKKTNNRFFKFFRKRKRLTSSQLQNFINIYYK